MFNDLSINRYKYKIELVTTKDCKDFVDTVSSSNKKVYLSDAKDYRVSASSFLGALTSMEWSEVYAECDEDCYTLIKKWVK